MGASLDALIPELQPAARALVDVANRAGVNPRITSTLRSGTEQARLYRRFLAGLSRYPAAPPGTSAHEYGWAFDLIVNGEENQYDLGSVWQSWGGVWGGASDSIHFEYPGFKETVSAVATASRGGPAAVAGETWAVRIAQAADLVLAFVPGIGQIELIAFLLSLGFPHSEVLKLYRGPLEYVVRAQ